MYSSFKFIVHFRTSRLPSSLATGPLSGPKSRLKDTHTTGRYLYEEPIMQKLATLWKKSFFICMRLSQNQREVAINILSPYK